MEEEALLRKAREIRAQEHRLKLSLRLRTLDNVVDFIHSKGLVSMLGGSELPSLVSALLGKPWKPTGKGFTSWLEWWDLQISGRNAGYLLTDIPRRKDILGTRIFRNNKTFVSNRLWPTLDPIVRRYQELTGKHEILSRLEWKIIDTLETKGPTRTDKLRAALSLEGKQHTAKFHRALAQLENHGLMVGYEDPNPEKHLHAAIWNLWDRRTELPRKAPHMSYQEAMAQLLEKTIDASVLVAESEVPKWFPWEGSLEGKEELVKTGRVVRTESYLVAARVAEE